MSKIIVKCNEKREIIEFSSTAFEDINKLDDSWYMTNLEGDGGMYSYPNSVYETYDEFGRPKYKLNNLNNIVEISDDEKVPVTQVVNPDPVEEIKNLKSQLAALSSFVMANSINSDELNSYNSSNSENDVNRLFDINDLNV